MVLLFLMGCRDRKAQIMRNFAEIPAIQADTPLASAGLLLGRREVTVLEYVQYLNGVSADEGQKHPQITMRQGRFVPARGEARRPVAFVSVHDAAAYCEWLSAPGAWLARLPTQAEWGRAARGGRRHAAFPWGWGTPKGRAHFAESGASRGGRYRPNPLGFYDLAGNLFEWCAPDPNNEAEECIAVGGSWAETDPFLLAIDRTTHFPCDYRDADVGFRVLLEIPRAGSL